MSHNVRLSGVTFTDLVSLGEIVNTVSEGKAKLSTDIKAFRSYFGASPCDATITLPGQYDIGLTKTKAGAYDPILESYLVRRGSCLGIPGAPLGLVQQEYALREAEYEAAQHGYTSERLSGDKGKITLRIGVPG